MPLGKEIGFGPGHIVLDWDPVGTKPPQQPLPTLRPCLLWPNGRPSQQLLSSCNIGVYRVVVSTQQHHIGNCIISWARILKMYCFLVCLFQLLLVIFTYLPAHCPCGWCCKLGP